jgi:preprotein translocase subunit SecA
LSWFSWLKSAPTNVDSQPDVIWVSEEAKLAGIRHEIEKASTREMPLAAIFVVAHFNKCLQALDGLGDRVSTYLPVRKCLAKEIGAATLSSTTTAGGQGIEIIVAERHPHAKYDEQLLTFAGELPYPCRLTYHLSFDDALLRVFGSEGTLDTLRRLGMKNDESIRSKMVSRRLQTAQKKVAKAAWSDLPAESADQWFELNAPSSVDHSR